MPRRKGERSKGCPVIKRPDPIVRERDLAILLEGRCSLKPMAQILEELNAVREEEARAVATERGLPAEAVEEFAESSRLSLQTLFADARRLRARMETANLAQGRQLFQRQYERLEVLRQSYLVLERRAWQELERSAAASLSTEETIDLTPTAEEDKALGELGTVDARHFSQVLRPKTRRVEQPAAADPRWFAILDQLLWKQVQLSEKMFELEAMLGLETPPDVAALAALTPEDARQGFVEHDLRMLYSPEARAAKIDPGAVQARFKYLEMWQAMKAKRAAGSEEGGGSGFRVVGLDPEQEPS